MGRLQDALYKCYWKLERIITPGLCSSQYAYYNALKSRMAGRPVWLDIGCGHQVFTHWMEREERDAVSQAGLAVGMDFDLDSLGRHQSIHLRLSGAVENLPFLDGSFDVVSANMVVEHLNDPARALAEIRRVLKPGGAFVFHTPNCHNPWVLFGYITPDWVKLPVIRLLEQRPSADVFPTRYRMNSGRAVREHSDGAGFDLKALEFVSTSAGTGALGPLAVFELAFIRLLRWSRLSRFRTNIVAVLEKPAILSDTPSSHAPAVPMSVS